MKVVIPAAGLGTRFLPLTKASPKEMMPIIDRPTIHYVVEEAVESGVDDILIVIGKGKHIIEDYFDRSWELENHLSINGKRALLPLITKIPDMASFHFIRQNSPKGLGDAVGLGRDHVGNEFFAVMLGDNITVSPVPVLKQLMDVHERTGGSVIGVERVGQDRVSQYGIVSGRMVGNGLIKVDSLVEKPSIEEAPSDIAITGTYVLSPTIFKLLKSTAPGKHGEIQLTDALNELAQQEDVYAYEFEGHRYDVGDVTGWLKTQIEFAVADPRYGDDICKFITEVIDRKCKER